MADLFWSYWDASVRFGILAFLLLVATPVLKRWISPKWLCWAWAALILRLFLPLALPYSGSLFNWSERLQPSTWTAAIRSGIVDSGWGETVIPKLRGQDDLIRSSLVGFSWETALVLLWVLGMLALLVGLFVNVYRLRRFFEGSTRHNSGRLYDVFKDVRRRFGINANVPLLVSDRINSPGIAGIFNPRVVIPQSCAENLTDAELRCVLLHELTHYRRGDLFIHHALLLICFIHWYNPLVWLVMRQFRSAMEQACDADVVSSDCVDSVEQYGLTLLRVMQRARGLHGSPAGALCLLGNRSSGALKERIHLIAAPRGGNLFCAALGLGVFGISLVYAITGEEVVEAEAERLFSLTRFSGPALFVSSRPDRASLDLNSNDFFLESENFKTPQNWMQDISVSEYRGQDVVVRIRYRLKGIGEAQDFWLNVKNADGRLVASAEESRSSGIGHSLREIEVPIRLSLSAEEIVCGLSTTGVATLWVESMEILSVL